MGMVGLRRKLCDVIMLEPTCGPVSTPVITIKEALIRWCWQNQAYCLLCPILPEVPFLSIGRWFRYHPMDFWYTPTLLQELVTISLEWFCFDSISCRLRPTNNNIGILEKLLYKNWARIRTNLGLVLLKHGKLCLQFYLWALQQGCILCLNNNDSTPIIMVQLNINIDNSLLNLCNYWHQPRLHH